MFLHYWSFPSLLIIISHWYLLYMKEISVFRIPSMLKCKQRKYATKFLSIYQGISLTIFSMSEFIKKSRLMFSVFSPLFYQRVLWVGLRTDIYTASQTGIASLSVSIVFRSAHCSVSLSLKVAAPRSSIVVSCPRLVLVPIAHIVFTVLEMKIILSMSGTSREYAYCTCI